MKKLYILIKKITVKFFAIIIIIFINNCAEGRSKGFKTADKFSLLWEITGNGIQKPSYLYGTIHIYDSTIFRIPEEVYAAIDLCDNFALEVDFNNIDQDKLLQSIMINDPDSTIDKLLEPEVYNEIQNVPFVKMMGDAANMLKPFYIQQYILIENPLTLQSVELSLNSYASDKSKNILGIETIDEQLNIIDAMPLSEQAQGIKDIYDYCKRENIELAEAGKKLFNTIQITYKDQDFEKLISLEDEFKMTSNSPTSDSAIIGSRNINMANRIDSLINQNKTLFVAVGALHLPDYKNLRGVVALLKEKGYSLRPLLIDLKIN
ncbi:MAG: TraB/GumN family protein [Prevotellaceae bacterium]|nr:TraB/GumN family protein [Prevotellaceae bacterium]